MKIGYVAKQTGISAKMIRYYESIGLIPPAKRSTNSYRLYTANDLEILKFIKKSRQLGFSLVQIKELTGLWHDKQRRSADVKELALSHIAQLTSKIQQLQLILTQLNQLVACCQGNEQAECAILEHIENHN